jgi:hypothetical protein
MVLACVQWLRRSAALRRLQAAPSLTRASAPHALVVRWSWLLARVAALRGEVQEVGNQLRRLRAVLGADRVTLPYLQFDGLVDPTVLDQAEQVNAVAFQVGVPCCTTSVGMCHCMHFRVVRVPHNVHVSVACYVALAHM